MTFDTRQQLVFLSQATFWKSLFKPKKALDYPQGQVFSFVVDVGSFSRGDEVVYVPKNLLGLP